MHSLPDQLKENIMNTFGVEGKKWLNDLPHIVENLTRHWGLSSPVPVSNMTYHYVAKANLDNQKVVIKIGCDSKTVFSESRALKFFNGKGAIKLIDQHEEFHALLLQQAIPGVTLKSFYPSKFEFVADSYIKTMQKLYFKPVPQPNYFPNIKDWLEAIDNVSSEIIPTELLNKAIFLKNKLLASPSQQFVLHGDLHHDNILKHDLDWLTIDPKGIVGEREFETAAFDFISRFELDTKDSLKKLFEKRAKHLSEMSGFDYQRIKDWVFVRLILSTAWAIEDHSDPRCALKLASVIF